MTCDCHHRPRKDGEGAGHWETCDLTGINHWISTEPLIEGTPEYEANERRHHQAIANDTAFLRSPGGALFFAVFITIDVGLIYLMYQMFTSH